MDILEYTKRPTAIAIATKRKQTPEVSERAVGILPNVISEVKTALANYIKTEKGYLTNVISEVKTAPTGEIMQNKTPSAIRQACLVFVFK